jgi:hypothetical protein
MWMEQTGVIDLEDLGQLPVKSLWVKAPKKKWKIVTPDNPKKIYYIRNKDVKKILKEYKACFDIKEFLY